MLHLTKQMAKITSFNPRAEKHGEENVPAGDIRLELTVHNSVLDSIHPGLRPFLFGRPTLGQQQSLIDADNLTAIVHPKLKPLKLDEDWPGYTLALGTGADIAEPLVLTEVELGNFTIDAKDGGSVVLSLSATCHPDEEQFGALCSLIQNTVAISLTPPAKPEAVSPQADLGDPLPGQDTLDQQEAQAEADRLTGKAA